VRRSLALAMLGRFDAHDQRWNRNLIRSDGAFMEPSGGNRWQIA
jgi:hypothetical protein